MHWSSVFVVINVVIKNQFPVSQGTDESIITRHQFLTRSEAGFAQSVSLP